MSSSEEDVVVAWQFLRNRRKRKRMRRYWIHPLFVHNLEHNPVTLAQQQLALNPEKFKEFYRMNQQSFKVLLELTGPRIEKLHINYRLICNSKCKDAIRSILQNYQLHF
ncbi:unnamed protein product [Psylliodes chrysocephalus]|uniref:Uncharacterized protein n=1 Tax=Psylliodes chrysocephalus TaxID=3402493 RepID=A0A9P0D0X3_9CUCU|nr:unnamed protein product [Psylliodes chrysocephala]